MRKRIDGAIQPGFRWGIFTLRVPLYHTRFEWPDFLQGLVVLAASAVALVPLMQSAFGLTLEEALACSMIQLMLIAAGPILFGDPYAPGWVTPALPITLAFVMGSYDDPTQRFQMMTALSLEFALIMLFFGATGLGQKFVRGLPIALKGGIILGASIASFKRVFHDDVDTFLQQPISTTIALAICLLFAFSKPLAVYASRHSLLKKISNMGLLPGFVVAGVVGAIVGEMTFKLEWGFLIPPVGDLWQKASPFQIGWPSLDMFLSCLPLALIVYTIAFGDFITGEEIIKEAEHDRPDEKIDFNVSRAHFAIGIRNLLMGVMAPIFPTQGVLLTGMHVVLVQRWRHGREYMDSLFSGISSFYLLGLPFMFFLLPIVTLLTPLMSIALSVTLVMTGFACAFVALSMPQTPEERGVAVLTGVCLALMEPWLGLLIGVVAAYSLVGLSHGHFLEDPDE